MLIAGHSNSPCPHYRGLIAHLLPPLPLRRAFRSRFLELHVEDIPDEELSTILEKR